MLDNNYKPEKIVAIRSIMGMGVAMELANELADTHEVKCATVSGDIVNIIMQEKPSVPANHKSRSTRSKTKVVDSAEKLVRTVRSKPEPKGSDKGKDKAEVQGVS